MKAAHAINFVDAKDMQKKMKKKREKNNCSFLAFARGNRSSQFPDNPNETPTTG